MAFSFVTMCVLDFLTFWCSNDKQLSNPVYDAMAENVDIKFTAR